MDYFLSQCNMITIQISFESFKFYEKFDKYYLPHSNLTNQIISGSNLNIINWF